MMGDYELDLDVGEYEEGEEPFVYDEDSPNLVEAFESHPDGEEALRKIAKYAIEKAEDARDSSEEYRQRLSEDNKLLIGDIQKKDWPFRNAANLNVPILLENLLRLHARMYSEIFEDWNSIMGVIPINTQDEPVAELLSLHGNWQFREDIPDFQRQADRMLMTFLLSGDVTCSSYYDSFRRQNRHECLTPDTFWVPYALTSTMPDYSDVPYVVKVLHMYRNDLQRMRGEFEHVDEILKRQPSHDDDPETPISSEANSASGIIAPDGDKYDAPYKLYQFEGWCHELPNQEYDRYVQVIVDPYTRHVCKLAIHEEVHWKDKVKERQMQDELDQYNQQLIAYRQLQQRQDDQLIEGIGEALRQNADVQTAEAMANAGMAEIPKPDAPSWMSDPDNPPEIAPSPVKQPIRTFTHGVNIEPMAGCLGVGFGRTLGDLSRMAITMSNQFIDTATLNNATPLLTSADMPEDLAYEPGKIIKVNMPVEELAKSIFPIPTPQPNPALWTAVGNVQEWAQSSVQAPDVLSGAPGKSGETYRGIQSRIEQATKQLTVTGRKFANFMRHIILANARLNSYYLDEQEIVRLMDPTDKMFRTITVSRAMYERDYKVEMKSDLKFSTEAQKQQESMEMVEMANNIPELQVNPSFKYQAIRKLLRSKGQEDMVGYLGGAPETPPVFGQPPMPPPGAVPPGVPPGAGVPPGPGVPPEGGMVPPGQ